MADYPKIELVRDGNRWVATAFADPGWIIGSARGSVAAAVVDVLLGRCRGYFGPEPDLGGVDVDGNPV